MPDRINVTIHMEDGAFWATVVEFPGVFATGDDLEELRASLEEGISLYISEPDQPVRLVRLPALQPEQTAASSELVYA